MNNALSRSIVNPGHSNPVTRLKGVVTTDWAIVTATMIPVLKRGGDAAEVA